MKGKGSKSITTLLASITGAAAALAASHTVANTAAQVPAAKDRDVWSTIERLSQDNQSTQIRIQIARDAGKSELVAALAQGLKNCPSHTYVETCVRRAIGRAGGLTHANLLPLTSLSHAFEAVGIPQATIARALDAYSTVVAETVKRGIISEDFAALTLAEEASGSLYL